jgi:hypothetical protein
MHSLKLSAHLVQKGNWWYVPATWYTTERTQPCDSCLIGWADHKTP